MTRDRAARRCPCGTGLPLAECCGRLHAGAAAATAEQLMRSRYSAFALGLTGYLLDTWHPDTRPATLTLDRDVRWTGLDVLAATGGSPLLAAEDTVEFRASYVRAGQHGQQHERSRFTRAGGRWHYLDGVALG